MHSGASNLASRSGTKLALAVGLLLTVLLLQAAAAQARGAANLSLDVNFFTNGTITVTTPSGTPIGTTSGTPTQIPAGYYAVILSGPGGCTTLPHFILSGPGESISDNMTEGEVTSFTYNAYFLPNSTYTWRSDASPGVIYTFTTTSDVQGSAPTPPGSAGIQASSHGTAQSTDVVGSGTLKLIGKLTGAVSTTGALSLTFGGKNVTSLKAGKYTLTVVDGSKKSGFMLEKSARTVTVTGEKFVGKRTETVGLTSGHWLLVPSAHGKGSSISVS